MSSDQPFEQVLRQINRMNRRQCIYELTHFKDIPLDFNTACLRAMSVERLRHVLTAAVVTVYRRHGRAI